jgi:hydroxymethylbilane synthase
MMIIGSRGSALALAQAGWVKERIHERYPDMEISIKIIKTTADKNISLPIRAGSAIGVFVKEIETALLNREIDIAVHSMKDVPTRIPEELDVGAIPKRADAHDALVANGNVRSLSSLLPGARVATGSVRRQSQIMTQRGDLQLMDIRGNIDTRLNKLATGQYDAIILAAAGLKRLGMENRIAATIDFSEMLPAPGQGALLLEIRKNDKNIMPFIAHLHDEPTAIAVLAERTFLRHVGGGCNVPVASYACLDHGSFKIEGLVAAMDGRCFVRESIVDVPQKAQEAAAALAETVLAGGGKAILDAIK